MRENVAAPLLEVRDLSVSFRTEQGLVRAVDSLSFSIGQGEVLGIVGESGSGKTASMTAFGSRIRRITLSIETVLPEPDSPTMPRTWPRPIENESLSTARTSPSSV